MNKLSLALWSSIQYALHLVCPIRVVESLKSSNDTPGTQCNLRTRSKMSRNRTGTIRFRRPDLGSSRPTGSTRWDTTCKRVRQQLWKSIYVLISQMESSRHGTNSAWVKIDWHPPFSAHGRGETFKDFRLCTRAFPLHYNVRHHIGYHPGVIIVTAKSVKLHQLWHNSVAARQQRHLRKSQGGVTNPHSLRSPEACIPSSQNFACPTCKRL